MVEPTATPVAPDPQASPEGDASPAAEAVADALGAKKPQNMRELVKGELRIQQFVVDPFEGRVTFAVVEGKTSSTLGFQKRRNFAQVNLTEETLEAFLELPGNPDEPAIETLLKFLAVEFDKTLDRPAQDKVRPAKR